MVRCRLDGSDGHPSAHETRFIPATEFDLWQHYMVSKHQRAVTVDAVSVWVPETPDVWEEDIAVEALEPVMRVDFDKPGPGGTTVPVVRYFPSETFPKAKAALLGHFSPRCRWSVQSTPGYFISSGANPARPEDVDFDEETQPHRHLMAAFNEAVA